MTLLNFIKGARPLSLTARACISLHITEAYLRKIELRHRLVDEFFNHLWEFPLMHAPREFSKWESSRGDFVDFALTDDLPDELEEIMPDLVLSEAELFAVVEAPVEILWGNFFQPANEITSFEYMKFSLNLAEKEGLIFPKLSLYQKSLYCDNNGWGLPISEGTRNKWRLDRSLY